MGKTPETSGISPHSPEQHKVLRRISYPVQIGGQDGWHVELQELAAFQTVRKIGKKSILVAIPKMDPENTEKPIALLYLQLGDEMIPGNTNTSQSIDPAKYDWYHAIRIYTTPDNYTALHGQTLPQPGQDITHNNPFEDLNSVTNVTLLTGEHGRRLSTVNTQ
jgi:hypothetical protein